MAPPIYFFPNLQVQHFRDGKRPRGDVLAKYGLEGVLGDVEDIDRQTSLFFISQGGPPQNGSGCVLTVFPDGEPPPRLGMHREHQGWTKVCKNPELWIGIDRDYPPGPEDLKRPRQVEGHLVKLADGREWLVPVIRSPDPKTVTRLPQNLVYDDAGELVLRIKPGHQRLWDDAWAVWQMVYGGQSASYADLVPYAAEFLGVNYRLAKWELSRLGLLDTEILRDVLCAVVDAPFLDELNRAEKKTEQADPEGSPAGESSSTGPGSEASGPSTAAA